MTTRLERKEFFLSFLKSPRAIGSVIPSSNRLARQIVLAIAQEAECIIELGGGTGPITSALTKLDANVICYEIDPLLSYRLQRKFPSLEVRNADAISCLSDIGNIHGQGARCSVVSSLPLSVMDKEYVLHLIREIARSLQPEEKFVCFFYIPVVLMPWKYWLIDVFDNNFSSVSYSIVLANFPPAMIIRCAK